MFQSPVLAGFLSSSISSQMENLGFYFVLFFFKGILLQNCDVLRSIGKKVMQ